MKKKLVAFIASAMAVISCVAVIAGCSSPKTFEKAGMQITLTSSFTEKEIVSQTAYYESTSAIVTVLKEEFTLLPDFENYTVSQYTDMVLTTNNLTAEKSTREGKDYMYFTYEKSVSGKDFYYLATTHKGEDAFWLIQFACSVSQKDSKTDTFLGWADTVTFVTAE